MFSRVMILTSCFIDINTAAPASTRRLKGKLYSYCITAGTATIFDDAYDIVVFTAMFIAIDVMKYGVFAKILTIKLSGERLFLNNASINKCINALLTFSGCDDKCQKECLDVLNEYRENHDAPKLQFSTDLADKAQKWADGGKFGYDMNAQGKYGQLIEWDVKHKLPSFTAAIKHWHDKEKDYDFAKQKSKSGRTLHDFVQVVWKKAHKAGCGRGTLFGSRYYVVWMDADGTRSSNLKTRANEKIGAPREVSIQ